jgi:hypothetical protein
VARHGGVPGLARAQASSVSRTGSVRGRPKSGYTQLSTWIRARQPG